jgi:hypothetical protein
MSCESGSASSVINATLATIPVIINQRKGVLRRGFIIQTEPFKPLLKINGGFIAVHLYSNLIILLLRQLLLSADQGQVEVKIQSRGIKNSSRRKLAQFAAGCGSGENCINPD